MLFSLIVKDGRVKVMQYVYGVAKWFPLRSFSSVDEAIDWIRKRFGDGVRILKYEVG
jgi:hypothetical protein